MLRKLHIWIICFIVPVYSCATHIVGGSLTYIYNGGSNYTITLKLYRDCGPTSAGFPTNVTITVLGNNGAAFSPSKDITMTLGTVTPVPSSLDPCAVAPNPLPCVQEGIYSITVNNLPPNAGGYHLYYQVVARNLSLTNINAACNCIGETFYADIPGMTANSIWNEDFNLPNNTTADNGATTWSITAGIPAPASASVNGNLFQITGANNAVGIWSSQVINTSSCSTVDLNVDLAESGTLEANDSISVYYRLNGGPLTLFSTNGFKADDFTSAIASTKGLVANTIQIIIRVRYDNNSPTSEIYRFDNILVSCVSNDFKPNNNPVFNLFPPLFICVNQPFTFNHAATDANGDSLVYFLYTPYNGDAGAGPLDPTFTTNAAVFTPVTYLPGFTATNPLGNTPFNLNPVTGLLTGTPGMLGQFVVGVVVKEYRNGVYIAQTLRDFQFNVLNCPQPPPALAVNNATVNNGCTAKLTATGITAASATWTSISPGTPGMYNNYLSCISGCLTSTVMATGTPPPYVDYIICGQSTSCASNSVCDTFRVTFNPTLAVNIIPINPTLCFGQTSTTLTAIGSGGTPPYSYLWNNINSSQSINVGVGTFNVKLTDASSCPPVYNSVTVSSYSLPVTANAGADKTICKQSPLATINASLTGATGGIWSGGSGVFSPNNTTLSNMTYSPTAAEIAAGSVNLYLTTTGNNACPSKQDTVVISYSGFTGVISSSVTNVSCFGNANGSATISLIGGPNPYTYLWNTAPTQTSAIATNLSLGTYSVTIKDGIGCSAQTTVSISQPTPLSINYTVSSISCSAGNNGSITIIPFGGTGPYTYSWQPGNQTTSSINSLTAGNYSVTVKDVKGCQLSANYSVTQPLPLVLTYTATNLSCFNSQNGSVNTTVTGGSPSYTYSWSPTASTAPNATGLQAGVHTLTVTDHNGCRTSSTLTVTQPSLVVGSITVTNESCDYLNNGSATVTATGGTPGYNYLWQGGITTSTINNLPSGTYSVKVTDSKGCSSIINTTVAEPSPLSVSFINQINVSCFGGSNGSLSSNPSGGTPNYTYLWSPGGITTATINNIPIGTYTVKVTDSKLCTVINTVTILQPTALTVTPVIVPVSCNNGNNGSISLTPLGGTSPYTYYWPSGGQTSSVLSGLSSGTYTSVITDSKGCILTNSYTVSQPSAITIAFTQTNVSCYNGNNGSSNANVNGGTPPYIYSWSPGGSGSQNINGLFAGTYTLTVKDNLNCIATNTVAITQPNAVSATTNVTNESCNYLNNGSATVTAIGGTPGYNYLWQPGGQTSVTAINLSSGTYSVTVTDSKGCTKITLATITEPNPLSVNFSNQISVNCFGGNNGSISSNPSGGTPNYSYSWIPGGSTTNALLNVTAGIYTLTVTDNKNCIIQNTISITQPSLALSTTVISSSVSCNGGVDGSVSAYGLGGAPSYSYHWMPGNINTQVVSSLYAGNYTVTVNDSRGCTTINTVTVIEPLPLLPVTSSTNSTCGAANGHGFVSVSGGVGAYTYSWSPSGGTNALASNLLSGAYTVLVADANGCSSSQFLNVNDSGGPVASIFSTTNVSCHGGLDGSATAGVTGGLAPLVCTWTPYGGSNLTATGLAAGIYYVTIVDANGCQSLATTSPIITEPPAITIDITSSAVSCYGGSSGSATVVVGGGTPGYSYDWLPGGTTGTTVTGLSSNTIYTLQVSDFNSCVNTATYSISQPAAALSVSVSSTPVSCFGGNDGSVSSLVSGGTSPYNYNWQPVNFSSQTLSNLNSGTYTITITDINGCTTTNSVAVIQPNPLVLVTGSINSNCSLANGQASVSVSGGTGAYTYAWSPNGGNNSIANGLYAGNYSVEVIDGNNCKANASQLVNDNPSPIVSITSFSNVSCNGGTNGSISSGVSGGTSPFTYSWSPIGGTGQTASGLPIGTYTVTVTAGNGCQVTATSPMLTEPSSLFMNISTTAVSCYGGSTGSATVIAGGGTPGYSYSWLPGLTTGIVVAGLSSNTLYTLQVSDANSCVSTATYSVSQPTAALSVSVSSLPVSCFGGTNGSVSAIVNGGTPVYSYYWLPNGSNGPTATGLVSGSYSVTITDIKGCATTASGLVTQPTQSLSAIANGTDVTCFGGSNGTASVTPNGGTSGYSYQWSPSSLGSAQTVSGLVQGNYAVTITDFNNCQTTTSILISEPTPITGNLISRNPSCGLANGSILSQISGGTGSYTYLWNPGSLSSSNINALLPGTFNLQVTDAANCMETYSATLINIAGPSLSLSSVIPTSCFGKNDGIATISISQGTAPFNVNWMPYGGNNTIASSLIAGTYTAIVIDSLGCQDMISTMINEPTILSVSVASLVNVSCYNGNDGTAAVIGSGGTPAYTYSWFPAGTGATMSSLTAGAYVVTLTDANQCANSISINVLEPALLTSSISSVVNAICFNGSGNASVNVTGGTAPYFYAWSSNPVQTGSTAQNIIPGAYSVTATDANGCISISTVTIASPAQIVTITGFNDTICVGEQATIFANATGGNGNYHYTWQPSGATNAGTFSVTPTINTTYTVVAFDQNGCSGNDDTVNVIVYNLTSSNIHVLGITPICPGQASSIYAQATGNTGPLTFTWNHNLGNGPGSFIVSPSQPTTYVVTVSGVCANSVTDSIQILFNPPPMVKILSDTIKTCEPGIIDFFDNSVTGNLADPITSWNWNFGDGEFSTFPNPTHSFSSAGIYTVNLTVTTDGGCTGNSASSPIIIEVYPSPVASFSVNATYFNLPFDIMACLNHSQGATGYFWDFGDGATSTITNPSHLYTNLGTFNVQLIVMNQYGCKDTAQILVKTSTDILIPTGFTPNENGSSGGSYNINSLDNDLFFPYTSGVDKYHLSIFNRWGELIFETFDFKQGWDGYYRGNICPQGVYIWKIDLEWENGKKFDKVGDVTLLR